MLDIANLFISLLKIKTMPNKIEVINPTQFFEIEVHFKFGNEQKDFEFHQIEAKSLELAIIEAKKIYRFTTGIFYKGIKQK